MCYGDKICMHLMKSVRPKRKLRSYDQDKNSFLFTFLRL